MRRKITLFTPDEDAALLTAIHQGMNIRRMSWRDPAARGAGVLEEGRLQNRKPLEGQWKGATVIS